MNKEYVTTSLKFALIGENTLPLKCAEIIRGRGHLIVAIISRTSQICQWANKHDIQCFPILNNAVLDTLTHSEFDYLLSIDNSTVLDLKILSLPKKHAVNYHDSLLPRYAGLNATAWAILNNEKIHGITWHTMDKHIDAGDILLQRSFPITEKETTLSLNSTCYEQAIGSFPCLLDMMESQCLVRKEQDCSLRTYYPATKVVENNGFVDLSCSSDHICRLYRALYYGPYANNLCLLKICICGKIYVINQLEICKSISSNRPGMLVNMGNNHLTISTKTQDIKISLTGLAGQPIDHITLTHALHVNIGDCLPLPNRKYLNRYLSKHKKYKLNEPFWQNQLKKCAETNLPIHIEKTNGNQLVNISSNKYDQPKEIVITSLILTLYKIQGAKTFTMWLGRESTYSEVEYLKDTYTCEVPFTFNPGKNKQCDILIKEITDEINEIISLAPFEREIFARDRETERALRTKDILIFFQKNEYIPTQISNYKLIFVINEKKGTISLIASNACLLRETDVHLLKNILSYNNNFIYFIGKNPGLSFRKLGLLSFNQQKKLLHEFNKTKSNVNFNQTIFDIIKKISLGNAHNKAVLFKNESFSYRKLFLDVEVVAKEIRGNTNDAEFIPIILKRSYEMIVCILAILKEGHAYVPIDWKWPHDRIGLILNHCDANFIISHEPISVVEFKTHTTKSILLDEDRRGILFLNINPDGDQKKIISAKGIAYLIYTSGTTGKPKAVMVTEKNVMNYHHWFASEFSLDRESIVDFSSSIAFDISVACTLVPLMQGSSIAICSEDNKVNPEKYIYHLQTKKVSHVECTPGYLSNLLRYPDHIKNLCDLKWLLLGAEKLIKKDVQEWMGLCPHHKLVNEYGPTECTVAVSKYLITRKNIGTLGESIPIGKPSYNNNFIILDEDGNVCPVGVPGELFVSGASVAKGYLNSLPSEKSNFDTTKLNHIFPHNGSCYATGDIVRWLYDGNVDYLDRRDRQVKIMGYRVELDAIKNSLIRHVAIRQCHLVIENKDSNNKWLTAYLVINDAKNFPFKKLDLISYLKKILPHYMIPSRYIIVSSIPLSSVSEKIDESNLVRYVLYELGSEKIPQENIENTISKLVSDMIGNKILHVDTNLFDTGMDSLMAIHLMAIIGARYHVKINLASILENSSVAKLANCIRSLLCGKYSRSQSKNQIIVNLKKSGDELPLFIIHPLGGGAFWYRNIPRYILPQLPVYALQDPSLECEGQFFFTSIKEMAASYIKAIKVIQPSGPYFLAGASFGAALAVEMAHQLGLENEPIAFLGILDGWAYYPGVGTEYIEKSAKESSTHYKELYGKEQEFNTEWHITLQKQRTELLKCYIIPTICHQITLFKANEVMEPFDRMVDSCNYWEPFTIHPLKIYNVSGTHSSIFELPNVKRLVRFLNKEIMMCLDAEILAS